MTWQPSGSFGPSSPCALCDRSKPWRGQSRCACRAPGAHLAVTCCRRRGVATRSTRPPGTCLAAATRTCSSTRRSSSCAGPGARTRRSSLVSTSSDACAQRRLELRSSAAQAVHHRPGGPGALLRCSRPHASHADSPLLAAQAARCCFPDSAETSLCLLHADSLTTWAPTGARTICLCVHEYPAC